MDFIADPDVAVLLGQAVAELFFLGAYCFQGGDTLSACGDTFFAFGVAFFGGLPLCGQGGLCHVQVGKRLSGEGEAAPRGGVPGNLYVVIHVAPHPQLQRRETELFYELSLSITQAALGARVTVPTATGSEQIEIKAGTQPGAEIRLRGRGVPHLRRPESRGDLHVLVDVKVPQRLSARQRELLEQLSAELGEVEESADSDSANGADSAAGATKPRKSGRRRGRRPGLTDRLRDAIS